MYVNQLFFALVDFDEAQDVFTQVKYQLEKVKMFILSQHCPCLA